jgi:hypothetical protein
MKLQYYSENTSLELEWLVLIPQISSHRIGNEYLSFKLKAFIPVVLINNNDLFLVKIITYL